MVLPANPLDLTLIQRFLAPSDFSEADTWRLVEWCRSHGADEFTIDCLGPDAENGAKVWEPFQRLVKPFARPRGKRERMSGRTADEMIRETELWGMNEHTSSALMQALPRGLFGYDPAEHGWFENPILYRDRQLMLGVLSHEAFAVLRVSQDEISELAAAGFRSYDSLPRVS